MTTLRRVGAVSVAAIALLCASFSLAAKKDRLPQFPHAELLVGWPPFRLTIATPDNTSIVEDDPQSDWEVTPSITADGSLVASARPAAGEPPQSKNLVASIWSRANQRWTDYPALQIRSGAVAISPDGSRLACVTRSMADAPSRLRVLDLASGNITLGPEILQSAGTDISWAPDSRRLAFDIGDNGAPVKANPTPLREIYIMDAETGVVTRLAKGVAPAWSPSGEWIAYLDYFPDNDDAGPGFAAPNPNRVDLMRADGAESRILLTWHRDENLMTAPVWSPDSGSLLINRWHDQQQGTVDLFILDLATGKLTRMWKNVPPVYAWIAQK